MKPQLFKVLLENIEDFKKDYRAWSKSEMIKKLGKVMGIAHTENRDSKLRKHIMDPDDTYVLTVDNLIKIMAIQMRFRLVFI